MTTETFLIAGVPLRLTLPDGFPVGLPASLAPFRSTDADTDTAGTALQVTVTTHPIAPSVIAAIVDDTTSDMGRVRLFSTSGHRWVIELTDRTGAIHHLTADSLFHNADIHLAASSAGAAAALNSLLRIAFSQRIITCGGLSVHASSVITPDGRSLLFLGPSATGKSTHSRLWLKTFPGTTLLNDDNPIVTIAPRTGLIAVHGSPWSGKTPCYRAASAPLCGILRLKQSTDNRLTLHHDVEAFATILPSCSTIRSFAPLNDRLCDSVAILAEQIPTATLRCRPDTEAARLAATLLTQSPHNPITQ